MSNFFILPPPPPSPPPLFHQYSCVFEPEERGIFGRLEPGSSVFQTLDFEFVVAQNMQKLRKLDSCIGSIPRIETPAPFYKLQLA